MSLVNGSPAENIPEGPSTQYLRTLVSKTISLMVWYLGPKSLNIEYLDPEGMKPQFLMESPNSATGAPDFGDDLGTDETCRTRSWMPTRVSRSSRCSGRQFMQTPSGSKVPN